MSVLIKGIEIPQNCFDCTFGLVAYERTYRWKHKIRQNAYVCVLTDKQMTSTRRNRFCPLMEVSEE